MRDALRRGYLEWAISHQTSLCATGHKERVERESWRIRLAPHTRSVFAVNTQQPVSGLNTTVPGQKAADGATPRKSVGRDRVS